MNTVQSAIVAAMMATGLTVSPPVNAQTAKTQYEVADAMNAEFLYELDKEAKYTKGKRDHQIHISTLRARFLDLIKFDTSVGQPSANPEYIEAEKLFEEAKAALKESRAKLGIEWGDWYNKKPIVKK